MSCRLEQMLSDVQAVVFDLDGTLLDRRRSFEQFVEINGDGLLTSSTQSSGSSTFRPL